MQATSENTGIGQVVKLAALVTKTAAAAIFLPGSDGRWRQLDGTVANDWAQLLCNQTLQYPPLLEIIDILHDDRFSGHPDDKPPYRCFASVLLPAAKAALPTEAAFTGVLAVMDPHPGSLKKTQQEALLAVADTAAVLLQQQPQQTANKIYEQFFSNAQALMCLHSLEGKLLRVNPASAAALGYTVEELEQLTLFDLTLPQVHEQVHQYLAAISHQTRIKGILQTLHKEGTPRIWLFNNVLEKNPIGEPYVLGNALDITERHALENTLKRTKEALEQTNSVARIGFWEFDVPKQKLYWSRVTRDIYEVDDAFVPDVTNGTSFFREDEHRLPLEAAVAAALQQGTGWDMELQLVTAKGREMWVRSIGNAEFEGGVCLRLYGTVQDIDERMKTTLDTLRAKTFLAAFVEHAPAAVAMLDKDLRYIAYSSRWLEDYGLTGQDLKGRSHYEVFPGISQEWRAIYRRCLKGAVDRKDEDVWRLKGSQQEMYLKSEVRPWFLYEDEIGGIIIFTQNITEARRHREELKVARKQAEQASRAKSEFLANMSHEIRTPLNGVIGFTDLLMKTTLSDSQFQYLGIVNESANVLLNIINDILDFSKIEANKLELDIGRHNLPELSSQVSDIIKYQLQQKDIEMLLNLSPQLPAFIWTDAIRLKQVLMNLLVNAVKFTEHGEIELKIRPASPLQNGHMSLRFEVRDTGIGIAATHQRKIFEAFSQADISITKKYGGTGLGLNISNRLLALMHSRLQLESELGIGSIFSFELPVKAEYDEHLPWQKPERISRALVVDDNAHNRIIIHEMLLLQHISSDQAGSGAEALQLLKAGNSYDVLVIDYHMPEMDGLETIRHVRGLTNEMAAIPIVLLHSSADDEKVIRACERYHVTQRLIKPIKLQDLRNALAGIYQQEERKRPVAAPYTRLKDKRLKILLAEDSPINMLLAQTIIKRAMPEAIVLEAPTGAAAIEMAAANRPDLIFMDMQMPGVNGYEATKQIRKTYGAQLPIIALTAANVKGEKEKCLAAGMDDFLSKPFVEADMIAMLEKWSGGNVHKAQPVKHTTGNTKAHFNIDNVLYYLGESDPAAPAVKEVVQMMIAELQQLENGFRQADPADRKAWYQLGHKLYGLAATTGLPALAALSRQLEQTANTLTTEELKTLNGELLQELPYCQQLLQDYQ